LAKKDEVHFMEKKMKSMLVSIYGKIEIMNINVYGVMTR
jgi:hypothetical protein